MVRGRDPNAVAVLLEDSAAVAGLLLATGCLALTSYTGNIIYDAIGSISIGGKICNLIILRCIMILLRLGDVIVENIQVLSLRKMPRRLRKLSRTIGLP